MKKLYNFENIGFHYSWTRNQNFEDMRTEMRVYSKCGFEDFWFLDLNMLVKVLKIVGFIEEENTTTLCS